MAAYAALVSIMHIIERIQQPPPPPNSLDKIQLHSITQNVAFLQDFLEHYTHDGSEEADELESRIRDAAYAAEDVIESHIVDQISGGSTSSHGEKISSIDLYQGLEKVIQDMGFIKEEVMDVKEKRGIKNIQLNRDSTPAAGSLRSPSTCPNSVVGFNDLLYEIMDKLTGGQLDRQIIPIYGMGGIGKTTLARNIFIHETIVQRFDILAWATISQEYNVREILLEIIGQENKVHGGNLSECELGGVLHKRLWGRRYLIVMDDMWVVDVWDKVKCFFPDNNNGSRVLITTRLSNVAFQLTETHGVKMRFLNEDESWDLLCKNVFGEEGCPLEYKATGKKIAENCRGLPLSIVVIGRALVKSGQTQEYWEYIAKNLSSILNLEDDNHCLKILSMSYNQLPVYLKPCFLHMGVFKEDRWISVPLLIKLWLSEGFLKPVSGKCLEAVAEEYLHDLIDRNLIFIHGSRWERQYCSIHDLLRDLCLRQAQREKFIYVASQCDPDIPQGISYQRRIVVRQNTCYHALQSLQSMSLVRSLIYDFDADLPSLDFRLLRVLTSFDENFDIEKAKFLDSLEAIFSQLINSRYLAITINKSWTSGSRLIPSSLYFLWNVHTLIVKHNDDFIAPFEIWKMPQLRHVNFASLELPDPHIDERDDFILGNLETLSRIKNFRCCEEVVKKIPNIKKLGVSYDGIEGWSLSCFDNLHRLKLESLDCHFFPKFETNWSDLLQNHTFPHSLKRLTLSGCNLHWEDITTKIGSLPLLQVLELNWQSTRGHKWETVEGGFPKLKFLGISCFSSDLECWISDNTHFPVLEHLSLLGLKNLEKIPLELGDILSLKSIRLFLCSDSAAFSAKEILDEQEQLENVDLQVRAVLWKGNEELESFKSRNFQVGTRLTYQPNRMMEVS